MLRRQTQKKSEGRLKIQVGGDSLMPLRCGDKSPAHRGGVRVLHRKGALTPEMGRQGRRGRAQLEMPHTLLWQGKQMALLAKDLPLFRQADSMVICGDREGTAWGQESVELKMTVSSTGLWGGELSQET